GWSRTSVTRSAYSSGRSRVTSSGSRSSSRTATLRPVRGVARSVPMRRRTAFVLRQSAGRRSPSPAAPPVGRRRSTRQRVKSRVRHARSASAGLRIRGTSRAVVRSPHQEAGEKRGLRFSALSERVLDGGNEVVEIEGLLHVANAEIGRDVL